MLFRSDLTEEEKQEALVNPRAELQGIEQGISTIENDGVVH